MFTLTFATGPGQMWATFPALRISAETREDKTKLNTECRQKENCLSCRMTHSQQKRGCERELLGKSPTACPGGGPERGGRSGRGLPRRCPARTATRGRRRRPGESASAVAPPRWRAGGACRAGVQEQDQTPHQLGRDCHGLGAGQGLTV